MSSTEDIGSGREAWAWQDTKQWVWLTNCQATNADYIMQIEEMYGMENTSVKSQAFDNNKVPLTPDYVAIFVKPEAYEAMYLTGNGVLPGG